MKRIKTPTHLRWTAALLLAFGWVLPPGAVTAQEASSTQEPAPQAPSLAEATQWMQSGQFEQAARGFGQILLQDPDNGAAWFNLGYSLHALGDLDRALKIHLKATEYPRFKAIALYNASCVYALKNDKDKAFEYLAKARDAGFNDAGQLREDSDMDNLREDPRFAKILARMDGGEISVAEARGEHAEEEDDFDFGPRLDLRSFEAAEQFNFLQGDWRMWANGQEVDFWRIKPLLGGKVWQMVGATSLSQFVYDPRQAVWRASWVSVRGDCDTLVGQLEGDSIELYQKVIRDRPGVIGRWTFAGVHEKRFGSLWSTSEDGGKTWKVEFELEFRRAEPNSAEHEARVDR